MDRSLTTAALLALAALAAGCLDNDTRLGPTDVCAGQDTTAPVPPGPDGSTECPVQEGSEQESTEPGDEQANGTTGTGGSDEPLDYSQYEQGEPGTGGGSPGAPGERDS